MNTYSCPSTLFHLLLRCHCTVFFLALSISVPNLSSSSLTPCSNASVALFPLQSKLLHIINLLLINVNEVGFLIFFNEVDFNDVDF